MMKNLMTVSELDAKDISEMVRIARKFKNGKNVSLKKVKNKTLALIFQKPSTRTRLSFEIAMEQMGGNSIFLSESDFRHTRIYRQFFYSSN